MEGQYIFTIEKKIALLNRITIVSLNKRQTGPLKRKSRRLLKRKSIELLKEDKSMFLIEYQSVFPIIKPKGFLNRNPISIHNRRTKGLFCGIPTSFPNESTNVPLNRILIDFFFNRRLILLLNIKLIWVS